jgi:hypothetical protein
LIYAGTTSSATTDDEILNRATTSSHSKGTGICEGVDPPRHAVGDELCYIPARGEHLRAGRPRHCEEPQYGGNDAARDAAACAMSTRHTQHAHFRSSVHSCSHVYILL